MTKRRLTINDDVSLSSLLEFPAMASTESPGRWIRILRSHLRMTQTELSRRAKVSQPHLVAIELGKIDPQVSTLRRLFVALGCDLLIRPHLINPIDEILRGRARAIALKRLKQSAGTMALEGQAPDSPGFKQLLEKRTDDILADRREKLWKDDE